MHSQDFLWGLVGVELFLTKNRDLVLHGHMHHILPPATFYLISGGAPHQIQPNFCLIPTKMPRKKLSVALGGGRGVAPAPPASPWGLATLMFVPAASSVIQSSQRCCRSTTWLVFFFSTFYDDVWDSLGKSTVTARSHREHGQDKTVLSCLVRARGVNEPLSMRHLCPNSCNLLLSLLCWRLIFDISNVV